MTHHVADPTRSQHLLIMKNACYFKFGMSGLEKRRKSVCQFLWLFEDARGNEIEDILILSGDQLYRMDYMDVIERHRRSGAEITISCLPVDDRHASDFGLVKTDNAGRLTSFSEKPKGVNLTAMHVDTTLLGLSREEAQKMPYIASMGIYVFKKDNLLNLLRCRFPMANDFGSEIIPVAAKEHVVKAYLFNEYWEDIGTIRSFLEANLALTDDLINKEEVQEVDRELLRWSSGETEGSRVGIDQLNQNGWK